MHVQVVFHMSKERLTTLSTLIRKVVSDGQYAKLLSTL